MVLGVERQGGGVTVEGGEIGGGAISESLVRVFGGGGRFSLHQRGKRIDEISIIVQYHYDL